MVDAPGGLALVDAPRLSELVTYRNASVHDVIDCVIDRNFPLPKMLEPLASGRVYQCATFPPQLLRALSIPNAPTQFAPFASKFKF